MISKRHRITAVFLAFLVLFSSTGLGMNSGLCCCTGKVCKVTPKGKNKLDCCKTKQLKTTFKKNSKRYCCSKNEIQRGANKKNDNNNHTLRINNHCCSSSCKTVKNNITPNFINTKENTSPVLFNPICFKKAINYSKGIAFFNNTKVFIGVPNNRPLKYYDHALLHWFQTYRC
ncbi:MAG: hypothetical protein MK207_13225 [Saprospiraceae bacterium]|nr:hypothetical protein [Saprospiraceae bacterium]